VGFLTGLDLENSKVLVEGQQPERKGVAVAKKIAKKKIARKLFRGTRRVSASQENALRHIREAYSFVGKDDGYAVKKLLWAIASVMEGRSPNDPTLF
jgi:hypothetical protein